MPLKQKRNKAHTRLHFPHFPPPHLLPKERDHPFRCLFHQAGIDGDGHLHLLALLDLLFPGSHPSARGVDRRLAGGPEAGAGSRAGRGARRSGSGALLRPSCGARAQRARGGPSRRRLRPLPRGRCDDTGTRGGTGDAASMAPS